MLVSILTVVYNCEKTIARTMQSVLNQTYPDIEYIVVDGASKDHTLDVIKSFEKQFNDTAGKSLTIISEPDHGMYDALNKAARVAHGELVGQINGDDWYEPDAVAHMVNLYQGKNYDVAWGNLRMISTAKTWIKRAKLGRLWTTSGWCHPAMFSKRTILLQFPYALESMYDDFDYITAVHQSNKSITVTDHIISNFTFGDGGQSTKRSLKEAMRRVRIVCHIYRKYHMSRFYYLYRIAYETAKCLLG